jgi:hypothetical protein
MTVLARTSSNLPHRPIVNYDLERMWKESVKLDLRCYPDNYLDALRKIMNNLRLAIVHADIQTGDLPNTRQKLYRSR